MNTKHLSGIDIKDSARGEVTAVFATLDVIDADGDVTLPGAFEDGAEIPISAYGHGSWTGVLPVGKGRVRTTPDEAVLEGQFFMATTHGRDAFETVKELGPLGQWSYGYDALDFSYGERDGRKVRFLKKLKVHEVSPVLVGAGVGTRTLAAKGADPGTDGVQYRAAIRPQETPTTSGAWDAGAVVAAIPEDASVSDLRSVFAWVDSEADPEAKSSYKFPHHQGVGGAANVRACIAGIAVLNGARGGAAIPEGDRAGVYSHLGSHLRDADREPPELRGAGAGEMKFADETAGILAEVSGFLDGAYRVAALRAQKGKTLSHVNTELLEWLHDDLRRLKSLIDTPADELAREYVRFVQNSQRRQT